MSTVSSLSPATLRSLLAGPGIDLETGPYITRLRTRIPSVAEAVGLLYADYPVHPAQEFADFHVGIVRPAGVRRWFGPQVDFLYDGVAVFRPLPLAQAFPMFEWGMNWCLSSRVHNRLIIHAAVVERHGRAAILPAPPGSGKSTLCAALVNNGWRLLSDELAVLTLDEGLLVPVPRPVSLKNASIDIVRRYVPGAVMSRPVLDTSKGTVAHMRAPADSVRRSHELAMPAWVIFPRYEAGSPPRLDAVAPADTFMQLAENAFNYSVLGARGFDALGRLVGRSASFSFTYSQLDDAIAAFDALGAAP